MGSYRFDHVSKAFVPTVMKGYVIDRDQNGRRRIYPDRYEFLVYRLVSPGGYDAGRRALTYKQRRLRRVAQF